MLDTAKLIGPRLGRAPPLVALPTTAGSGSEATAALGTIRHWPLPPAAALALSRAAVFDGTPIAWTRTTLSHAMSYPLTLHYRVPHDRPVPSP